MRVVWRIKEASGERTSNLPWSAMHSIQLSDQEQLASQSRSRGNRLRYSQRRVSPCRSRRPIWKRVSPCRSRRRKRRGCRRLPCGSTAAPSVLRDCSKRHLMAQAPAGHQRHFKAQPINASSMHLMKTHLGAYQCKLSMQNALSIH